MTESESEDITKFLGLLSEIMSNARSVVWISAEKMEFSFGRSFLIIFWLNMAVHAVLL